MTVDKITFIIIIVVWLGFVVLASSLHVVVCLTSHCPISHIVGTRRSLHIVVVVVGLSVSRLSTSTFVVLASSRVRWLVTTKRIVGRAFALASIGRAGCKRNHWRRDDRSSGGYHWRWGMHRVCDIGGRQICQLGEEGTTRGGRRRRRKLLERGSSTRHAQCWVKRRDHVTFCQLGGKLKGCANWQLGGGKGFIGSGGALTRRSGRMVVRHMFTGARQGGIVGTPRKRSRTARRLTWHGLLRLCKVRELGLFILIRLHWEMVRLLTLSKR
mmetsp:Transcript_19233/g.28642  ORF Transcript_19233/g.28642 Transcript_19233/m.28642 type:complete len:270 (-) Transcript_19233:239-1048(-)